jgi:hypothetical protein
MQPIAVDDLLLPGFRAWRRDGFLLAAGDFAAGTYNCMTVGWGGIGCLWDRPVALVAVKPTRHTFDFLERFPSFTLNHFTPEFRKALLESLRSSSRAGHHHRFFFGEVRTVLGEAQYTR